MKCILSQALNMKYNPASALPSQPLFIEDAAFIANQMKKFSPWELQTLLNVNEKIADHAFIHYQEFDKQAKGHPALFAYNGLVYKNICPDQFTEEDLAYAQKAMVILSGFYGVLKPLDGILPYRLELMTPLKLGDKNLYHFWSDKLYRQLYQEQNIVINLASEEYAKAIRKYLKPQDAFIDILFKTMHKGKFRVIVTDAKAARGQMARYIIKNRIKKPEELKKFTGHDFKFEESLSDSRRFVFIK